MEICVRQYYEWQMVGIQLAAEYDVIYWWITHDGVEDVLSGYEFSTSIVYQTEGGEEEKFQVGYN
jgi:hypothetical protein